jgi:predicted dehydrogenase
MKKTLNAGIVGTGFGSYVLLEALNQINFVKDKIILGRSKNKLENIKKKQQVNKIFESEKKFLKEKLSLICLATLPIKQFNLLKKIRKYKYTYYFLEKPLANNLKNTKFIFNKFKNLKTRIAIDFIFLALNSFLKFKKLIKKKKINRIKIKWSFYAYHYKKNIKDSWKKNQKYGGGIYYYYIIHSISYIHFLFGKIISVKKKKEFKDISGTAFAVKLELILEGDIHLSLSFNSKSTKNIHSIEVCAQKNIYKLVNTSKDFVKNFKIFKLDKKSKVLCDDFSFKINQKIDSRVLPVKKLILKLLDKKPISNLDDALQATEDLQKILLKK